MSLEREARAQAIGWLAGIDHGRTCSGCSICVADKCPITENITEISESTPEEQVPPVNPEDISISAKVDAYRSPYARPWNHTLKQKDNK